MDRERESACMRDTQRHRGRGKEEERERERAQGGGETGKETTAGIHVRERRWRKSAEGASRASQAPLKPRAARAPPSKCSVQKSSFQRKSVGAKPLCTH